MKEEFLMKLVNWLTLAIAVGGWGISIWLWFASRRQHNKDAVDAKIQHDKDVEAAKIQHDKDLEAAKIQREEDNKKADELWKNQKLFNQSLSSLNVEAQLNQINNANFKNELKPITIKDTAGNTLGSALVDFLKFYINSGWLSRIYVIESCFKDEEHPYVDMTKYYNNAQNFGINFVEHTENGGTLWIEEVGNRIRIFCKEVINFYPEINPSTFYHFYLVEGSDKKYQLFMYGKDIFNGNKLPFVMDRRGIASTVNTVNPTFRKEYFQLSEYLQKSGYNIV